MSKIGIHIPTIYMPAENIDLTKWSVVACDQYTSQPEYWEETAGIVGDSPSTLHLIFPEVYLEEENREDRIKKINETMQRYLDAQIIKPEKPGFIFVDRQTSRAPSRKGLIMAIDLEEYDYHPGSQSLIRATEGTVIDRLPPRVKIRQNAPIELPHVMVLIDDPERTVIEPLADQVQGLRKLYDFELMQGGGHIKGYKVDDEKLIDQVIQALERLADPESFRAKYGVGEDKGVLLFAVGDGNHSLASAKQHWENLKQSLPREQIQTHPARFALVEIVNVHDDGLQFEPIHRLVFQIDPQEILQSLVDFFRSIGSGAEVTFMKSGEALKEEMAKSRNSCQVFSFISKEKSGVVSIENPPSTLPVGSLQLFLDEYAKKHNCKIDYIHGEEVVTALAGMDGNIGFYLPPVDKQDLFRTVILDGVLPRKTFSMGEANEKRYYLECRKIR